MTNAEHWWAIGVGIVGLLAFAGGWLLMSLPPIDASDEVVVAALVERRSPILIGALLAVLGGALLVWPVVAVATAADGAAWASLRLFSVAVWLFAFGLLGVGALIVAALTWRDPRALAPAGLRVLSDASHLAVWSISAPLAVVAVVTTTAVGVDAGFFGAWVVGAAVVKVVTALAEVGGVGRRTGWNAGGWAFGASGYATVLWFAVVLAALPAHS